MTGFSALAGDTGDLAEEKVLAAVRNLVKNEPEHVQQAIDALSKGMEHAASAGFWWTAQSSWPARRPIDRDITVTLPEKTERTNVLETGLAVPVSMNPVKTGYLLAFDIGTTTVVGYLLNEQGRELSSASMLNPQEPFGADMISRIQLALNGKADAMTACIRDGLAKLTREAFEKSGVEPSQIGVVCVVGNPCMQQLFLGLSVKNLATVPFAPSITESNMQSAKDVDSIRENALLLTPPDISGYVGADTMGCISSTKM